MEWQGEFNIENWRVKLKKKNVATAALLLAFSPEVPCDASAGGDGSPGGLADVTCLIGNEKIACPPV